MQNVFITGANPSGYAIGTTVTVSDAIATAGIGAWCVASATRLSNSPSPSDIERTEAAGPGGGGITALTQATDYNQNLVAPLAAKAPATTLIPSGNHTLLATDNNGIAENETAATITVNIGLGATFGCGFQGIGVLTFNGTAAVNDKRISGSAYPVCSLFPTSTVDVYNLIGSKA